MHYLTHPTQKVFEAKYSDPMNQMPFSGLKKATHTALPESIEFEVIKTATLNISSVDFPNL